MMTVTSFTHATNLLVLNRFNTSISLVLDLLFDSYAKSFDHEGVACLLSSWVADMLSRGLQKGCLLAHSLDTIPPLA